MQISNTHQTYNYHNQNNTITQKTVTPSFADHMQVQSSYKVDISSSIYTSDKPLFTDYFQSAGRGMKNQTSFNETWINPDNPREIVSHKGVYNEKIADEDVPKDKSGRRFIDLLPQSYFDNMNSEDEKRYREIMDDSHISYGEVDSLSFDQVKNMSFEKSANILLKEGYSIDEIPLFSVDSRVDEFFSATEFTSDGTFNRAIFKTIKEATNVTESQIMSATGQLQTHFLQKHFNKEFQIETIGGSYEGGVENLYFLEKNNIKVNYDEFLNQALNYYGEMASDPMTLEGLREQSKFQYEWYFTLRENYNYEKNLKS